MKSHHNHRTVSTLLDTLRHHPSPCTRSELAGYAQLTIRQISQELEYLVELGAVQRIEDELSPRYRLRELGLRPPGAASWA